MYFIDLKGLIQQLKSRQLKPSEEMAYIFAFAVMNLLTSVLFPKAGHKVSVESVGIGILFGGIGLGIAWALLNGFLKANGGDKGQQFISRLLALAWVVSFRVTLVLLPFLAAMQMAVAYKEEVGVNGLLAVVAVSVIILIGALVYSYLTIKKSLKEISSAA